MITPEAPNSIHQMLMFRINRYFNVAGALATRLCETQFGLTRREWGLMATVANQEGLLSSELADAAKLDRVRTSRTLGSLEAKGWIQRVPLAGDRRRVTVSLTDAGRKMYERVLPAMARFNMELVATLTPEEQAQMDAILLKLRARALEMEQDGPYAALPRVDRGHKHG